MNRPLFVTAGLVLMAGAPARADYAAAIEAGDHEAALVHIDASLLDRPEDPMLRFQRARVLGFIGDDEASLSQLDELCTQYPGDVDFAFARGALLNRMGRIDDALAELDRAARLAPDYEDVWRLRFQVASRHRASEIESVRDDSARRFPDADWWQSISGTDGPVWSLTAGAGVDDLSGGLPGWNEQFADARRSLDGGSELRFRARRNTRYSSADVSLGAGYRHAFSADWSASADVDLADTPAFQPEVDVSLEVTRAIGNGWQVAVGGRSRQYPADRVTAFNASLERYFGDFRLAYSLGLSRLNDASTLTGHAMAFNWYLTSNMSVGISANRGREAESIGGGRVLESDVWGVAVSGHRDLSDRIAVRWWLGVHEQGDFYRRRFLGMAVTVAI